MVEPHSPAGYLIFTQRLPRAPDRHSRQPVLNKQHQQDHQTKHGVDKDKFEVGVIADVQKLVDGHPAVFGPPAKLEAEQRRRRDGNPIRSAGKTDPVIQHQADNFAKPEGDNRQIIAMHSQHRKSQQRTGQRRHNGTCRQHCPESQPQILITQRQPVGTNSIKGHIAQIEQARQTDHNIQPQSQQDINQPENGDRQQIFRGDDREQDCEERQQRNHPAQPRTITGGSHVYAIIRSFKTGEKLATAATLQQQTEQQSPNHHDANQYQHPLG